MSFVLTPGQDQEAPVFERVMEGGAVHRSRPGRPKQKPHRVAGDKGYDSAAIRT